MSTPTAVSEEGRALIKHHEGCRLTAYLCPANKVTIGYGHVIVPSWDYQLFRLQRSVLIDIVNECVRMRRITQEAVVSLRLSPQQVDDLLAADLRKIALFITSTHQGIALTQAMFDALASLIFNIGQGNYAPSTLRKNLLRGDLAAAAAEFDRWVFATVKGQKQKLPGLITRRAAERTLFERR